MKRLILSVLTLMCLALSVCAQSPDVTVFAHRGCWSKNADGEFIIPENSVAAVKAARKSGYVGIECDVRYTKDGRMVVLHDNTLNRTVRKASDYSKLDKPVKLSSLTFEELRRDYVLESEDPSLRTPVPTLEEILMECKRQGMVPMLHSSVEESYRLAQEIFGNKWVCFTSDYEKLVKVRGYSDCVILYSVNAGPVEEVIQKLSRLGGDCGISSMKYNLYTAEFCKALTDAGYEVQASIFPAPEEEKALSNGITYILTDHRTHTKKEKRRVKVSD